MRIADLQLLNNKFSNCLCNQNLAFYMKENYVITGRSLCIVQVKRVLLKGLHLA